MNLLRNAVVLALGCSLASGSAAVAQVAPDSVSLRYAWSAGMTAEVEHEWSRVKRSPGGTDSLRVSSRYRMQVFPHEQGLLVRTDRYRAPEVAAPRSDSTGFLVRLVGQLSAVSPGYVVSPAGEFLRVEGVAAMKSTVDSLFAPVFGGWEEMPPQAEQLLQSMLSERALTASAAQGWNVMVGQWVDVDFEVGAVYTLETEEPSPLLPGVMIPSTYEFSAAERVPCEEAAGEPNCVLLTMYSTADPEAVRAAARQVMERMGVADDEEVAAALQSLHVEHELTVIAEPHTLRPYHVELVKRVTADGGHPEQGGAAVQEDRRVSRYSYRQ